MKTLPYFYIIIVEDFESDKRFRALACSDLMQREVSLAFPGSKTRVSKILHNTKSSSPEMLARDIAENPEDALECFEQFMET
jgi:hypothetical protein